MLSYPDENYDLEGDITRYKRSFETKNEEDTNNEENEDDTIGVAFSHFSRKNSYFVLAFSRELKSARKRHL